MPTTHVAPVNKAELSRFIIRGIARETLFRGIAPRWESRQRFESFFLRKIESWRMPQDLDWAQKMKIASLAYDEISPVGLGKWQAENPMVAIMPGKEIVLGDNNITREANELNNNKIQMSILYAGHIIYHLIGVVLPYVFFGSERAADFPAGAISRPLGEIRSVFRWPLAANGIINTSVLAFNLLLLPFRPFVKPAGTGQKARPPFFTQLYGISKYALVGAVSVYFAAKAFSVIRPDAANALLLPTAVAARLPEAANLSVDGYMKLSSLFLAFLFAKRALLSFPAKVETLVVEKMAAKINAALENAAGQVFGRPSEPS